MLECPLDFETKSIHDISAGTDRYMDGASPLICTYGPEVTECWDITADRLPLDLESYVRDESVIFIAHNAPFDHSVSNRLLKWGIPAKRWRCTRVQAYAHGFPGSLESLGELAGCPKMKEGAALIQLFCVPRDDGGFNDRFTHPNEWALFKTYAIRDTDSLRKIRKYLPAHNYQGKDLQWAVLDRYINERGFQFDTDLARAAVAMLDKAKTSQRGRVYELTNGEVMAATQREKLMRYFVSRGVLIPNMRASTLKELLDQDDLPKDLRFLVELRLESAKASGAKFNRGLKMVGRGDRIRHSVQCNGAGRTGRSAGKGYQPHNMMRPTLKAKMIEEHLIPAIIADHDEVLNNPLIYGEPNTACANTLRGAIKAALGNELVVADWSNIESRYLAWLADEHWKLEAYRAVDRHIAEHGPACKCGAAPDLYVLLYSKFFGVGLEAVGDNERQSGKVVELACGFGGGVGAFVTMAAGYGIDLTTLPAMVIPSAKVENYKKAHKAWRRAILSGEDYGLEPPVYIACDLLKQAYREANKAINQLRHDVDRAVKDAVRSPNTLHHAAKCKIWSTGNFLILEMASGRRLLYAGPQLHREEPQDAETGEKAKVREYLTFRTARGKSFITEKAWAGLFLENIVQAGANEVLRDAAIAVHNDANTVPEIAAYLATLPEWERTAISMHVHDEIILDVPKGSYPLARLIRMMVSSTHWAPGLPLAAAGYIGPRFKKG